MRVISNNFRPWKRVVHWLVFAWFVGVKTSSAQQPDPEKLRYAREVEQKALAVNDSSQLAEAYYLYGKNYVLAGDYTTSQNYFLKAINLLEPKGASFELGRLYLRISENESRRGVYPAALQYARHALHIFRQCKSDDGQLRAYDNLRKLFGLMNSNNSYDTLAYYYRESEKLVKKTKDTLAMAALNLQLGSLYVQYHKPGGIDYLKKAIHLYTARKEERSRIYAMIELAQAYLSTGQYDLAFENLKLAGKLQQQQVGKDHDLQMALDHAFTIYYRETGQWKSAHDHLLTLYTAQKEKLSVERDSIVSRLNVEFNSKKKEADLLARDQELQLKARNIKTQRNFIVTVSVLLGAAMVMSYVLYRLNRKNKRISRQNAELVKEQNHRVKNNLQIVSSLLYLQARQLVDSDAKKAIEDSRLRIRSMSLVHQKLHNSEQASEINLHEFFTDLSTEVLHAYDCTQTIVDLEVENIQLSVDLSIPLGLILTELLTNACKYAFHDHPDPQLFIRCTKSGEWIRLTVSDNGSGMADTTTEQSKKSFGMRLIRLQVDQLYGSYQFSKNSTASNEAGFRQGTQFTMEFKVRESVAESSAYC